MLKTLRSFIALKYSVFSFLFLGSFIFYLLSSYQDINAFSIAFFRKLFFGIPALFFARSFGMIINQIIDCDIDKENTRTSCRVLPAKLLSLKNAFLYTILSAIIFLFFSYCISFRCFLEAFLVILVIIIYPYIKRFHISCHFVLGLIYSFAVIMVGEALLQRCDLHCFIYAIIVGLFISANDIIYSLLDKEFDQKQGLFSFPSILGNVFSILTVYFCYSTSFLLLVFLGFLSSFSFFYYVLLFNFFLVLAYLSVKFYKTLMLFSSKRFISWEKAFFISNILISSSLFFIFIILFITKLK